MSIVCKGGSISHGAKAIEYALGRTLKEDFDPDTRLYKKDTGIEIAKEFERNSLNGVTAAECWHEMEKWKRHSGHSNIKRDALWITIAPSAEVCDKLDGNELEVDGNMKGWNDLYDEFIQRMHLENTMRIAVMHDRTERTENGRKHIHLLVSRIDLDGKVISDHHFGQKTKRIGDELARDWHLDTAAEIGGRKKEQIKRAAIDVLAQLPEYSFDRYKEELSKRGINVEMYADKKGNVKGYRMYIGEGGFKYKSSDIDRGLSLGHIQHTFNKLHDARAVCMSMNIERVAVWRNDVYDERVKVWLNDGHTVWKNISSIDYYAYTKKQMTNVQIAAKYLIKNGGRGCSYGYNREWEVGVHDDYEESYRSSQRISR